MRDRDEPLLAHRGMGTACKAQRIAALRQRKRQFVRDQRDDRREDGQPDANRRHRAETVD